MSSAGSTRACLSGRTGSGRTARTGVRSAESTYTISPGGPVEPRPRGRGRRWCGRFHSVPEETDMPPPPGAIRPSACGFTSPGTRTPNARDERPMIGNWSASGVIVRNHMNRLSLVPVLFAGNAVRGAGALDSSQPSRVVRSSPSRGSAARAAGPAEPPRVGSSADASLLASVVDWARAQEFAEELEDELIARCARPAPRRAGDAGNPTPPSRGAGASAC